MATTHEGKDMNVISCHIHHFDSEDNVWTWFKGSTLKDSWDQKMEEIKPKYSKKKKKKLKNRRW